MHGKLLTVCALAALTLALGTSSAAAKRPCKEKRGVPVHSVTATGTTCRMAYTVAAHASASLEAGGCAFLRDGITALKTPCVKLGYHCKPLFHSASLRAYYIRCRKHDDVAIWFLL